MMRRDRRRRGAVHSQHRADALAFQRARLHLAVWYVATLALIVVIFSGLLYLALQSQLSRHQNDDIDTSKHQIEEETADFVLDRLRLILVTGNIVFLIGTAGGAYVLAGKTLQPIALAFERQRRFTADASHELRTPLTVMGGTVDVALQHERSTDYYRQVLGEVRAEVDTMSTLAEHLLRLARGGVRSHPESCDLRAILDDVLLGTGDLAASKGSRVFFVEGPPLWTVGDRIGLRQLFSNLVQNALQHTPRGMDVRVTTSSDSNHVEVTISDTGPGIPATQRERIFEPFARLQTTGSDGTGLGLTLSRELAGAHGGSISVEDTAGGGATFRVRLPRAQQTLRAREAGE